MTTVHEQGENWISCVKGAPDVILKRCRYEMEEDKIVPLTRERRTEIEAEITRMSARALRVLAGAYRELQTGKMPDGKREKQVGQLEQNLIFLGLAGMMDPPREAAAGAVEAFRRASVRTVMITGDHADTALAIARQLGIAKRREECMTGAQLETLDEGALEERIGSVSVFARVSPEHKVRIVRALKRAGCVTAMTGDGVNDAPALKSADIGIAMGKGGTDVARQAADMILTDDNFATIERAIEEGRGIYENIRKSILFLLSSNLGEILTMFAAVAIGIPAPLGAGHILWINLITDSLPALALGMERAEADIMQRRPRDAKAGVFAGGMGFDIAYQGLLVSILTLMSYFVGHFIESGVWEITNSPDGTTMAFVTMSMAEIFHSFNMRSEHSVLKLGLFSNRKLVAACGLCAFLMVSVVLFPPLAALFKTTALTFSQWLLVAALSLCPLLVVEGEKLLWERLPRKRKT